MTDADIAFTTYPGEAPPERPAPSEEDWAVLASGGASPWLRERLLEVALDDPDAADRLTALTDPEYRLAIAEAGDILRQVRPSPAAIVAMEPQEFVRRVAIRIRPTLGWFFGGIAAFAAAILLKESFYWPLLAIGLVCLLCFAIDKYNTHPFVQEKIARASGDHALADAILEHVARSTGTGGR